MEIRTLLTVFMASRKPRHCPKCGNSAVASILYGMPDFSPELECKLAAGKVVLGGCCKELDDPAWECTKCGKRIYRKKVNWRDQPIENEENFRDKM